MVVWKMPKGPNKEQALWRIAHALEQLMGEQAGFQEEMARIWESSERMEDILQVLVDQTKASLDMMELFMWGKCFLRTWEMGKLEGLEEVECVLRKHHKRWGTVIREKETALEWEPEVVLEVVLEVDVEITLQ